MIRFACSRAGARLGDLLVALGRRRGAAGPLAVRREGPYFDNQVCFLELDGPLGAAAAAEDRAARRGRETRATGWRRCSSAG